MGNSEDFPIVRDISSTTASMADLIAALQLPSIEPLATDMQKMSTLPPLPEPDFRTHAAPLGAEDDFRPGPTCQLDTARALMNSCVDAIEGMKRHQNRCAAFAARVIEKLQSTVSLEGSILALDPWQQDNALSSMEAELAAILQIPEGSASRLMAHAATLVRTLPATMEHLDGGILGWEHAVIIAEETTLLRASGIAEDSITAFELLLLGKAAKSTLPSFKEKARRIRERRYPESIIPRTRRAYADRHMSKNHDRDGMSWLSFYAPSPTVEGIWDQCTAAAQAAQGQHEERTLAQLRIDVAAAMLLNQSLAENNIYAPPSPSDPSQASTTPDQEKFKGGASAAPDANNTHTFPDVDNAHVSPDDEHEATSETAPEASSNDCADSRATVSTNSGRTPAGGLLRRAETSGAAGVVGTAGTGNQSGPGGVPSPSCPEPDFLPVDPASAPGSFPIDADSHEWFYPPLAIPVFNDPDYWDPSFREPDPRNRPDWIPTAKPPTLLPTPPGEPLSHPVVRHETHGSDPAGNNATWPPLPKVLPVLLVPALSMLGATDEPAWMQGVGPISMEVARQLMSESSSLYRVLVDPVSNEPLDCTPDLYRITKAMRTMLLIRDEYCQFPGCMAKASSSQIDHIESFESGGSSTFNNLECLCLHHHLVKHFRDDKTRNGQYRTDQSQERQRVSLRGWVPRMESSGRVAWLSPTGRNYPSAANDRPLMHYPQWLQRLISEALLAGTPDATGPDSTSSSEDYPEEPIWFRPTYEDEAILSQLAVERALQDPTLGLAEAS